jgi:hypothetical protein
MNKLFCTIIISLFVFLNTNAQSFENVFRGSSLDVSTDAANTAMGESAVANISNLNALFENPAAIYNHKNFSGFYNYRYFGWNEVIKNSNYYSAGITTSTNIGNFAFSINKFTTGKFEGNLDGDKTEDRNSTFILAYSKLLIDNFTAGVSAKLFNRKSTTTGQFNYETTSTNTILFDVGLLYTFNNLQNSENFQSDLSLGASLQNFGTDYKEDYNYLFNETIARRLPRYFRIGFAYAANLTLGKYTRTDFDLLITGEYKNLLNPYQAEKDFVDYWSGGIEATLFKIISLRAGVLKSPEGSILFDRNKFNWRYGAGLNIPIFLMGLKSPLQIKFDYSIIPVNTFEFTYTSPGFPDGVLKTEKTKNHLYVFGVSINYPIR